MSDTAPSPAQEKIRKSFSPTFYAAFTKLDRPSREAFCKLLEATQQAGLDWWQIKQGKTTGARCGRYKTEGNDERTTNFFTYNASSGKIWTSTSSTKMKFGRLGVIPRTPLLALSKDLIAVLEEGKGSLEKFIHERLKPRPSNVAFLPQKIGFDTVTPKDDNEDDGEENGEKVTRTGNWIYYGPPGTGKTHELNPILKGTYGKPPNGEPELEDKDPKKRYAFVTFHQSYGYEEFVEGLRPVLDEASAEGGQVRYEIRAGVFKALCEKARDAEKEAKAKGTPDAEIPRYAMVIDEINRGNISKIFGELITLIEDDKREGMPNAVSVILPYSGKPFSVPANVDIIGTMNTADRSLALLDTALRRRFEFVPMLPDPSVLEGIQIQDAQDIDLVKMLSKMNERIEALYDRDHCIGHAYFTKLNKKEDESDDKKPATLEDLGAIFKNKIIPLLQEYFFEDWNKIRLVLGDNQKKDATTQFIKSEKPDKKVLFGSSEIESLPDPLPPRFSLNDKDKDNAFDKPASYIGIYKTPDAV